MLHKEQKEDTNNIEFKEEQRAFLCSNKNPVRCSSLNVIEEDEEAINNALQHLASILVEGYLKIIEHERNNKTKQ